MTGQHRLYILFKCRSPHMRLIDDCELAFFQLIYFPRSRCIHYLPINEFLVNLRLRIRLFLIITHLSCKQRGTNVCPRWLKVNAAEVPSSFPSKTY